MPAPTSYTESALIGFMETELGSTGVVLGLLEGDALLQAAWAVQRLLGVPNLTAETDMVKLEAAARWKAWEAAEAAATSQFNVSLTGGKKFERSLIFKQIQSRLARTQSTWCALVEDAEDADCGFEIAEMVVDDFSYRARLNSEGLRVGY